METTNTTANTTDAVAAAAQTIQAAVQAVYDATRDRTGDYNEAYKAAQQEAEKRGLARYYEAQYATGNAHLTYEARHASDDEIERLAALYEGHAAIHQHGSSNQKRAEEAAAIHRNEQRRRSAAAAAPVAAAAQAALQADRDRNATYAQYKGINSRAATAARKQANEAYEDARANYLEAVTQQITAEAVAPAEPVAAAPKSDYNEAAREAYADRMNQWDIDYHAAHTAAYQAAQDAGATHEQAEEAADYAARAYDAVEEEADDGETVAPRLPGGAYNRAAQVAAYQMQPAPLYLREQREAVAAAEQAAQAEPVAAAEPTSEAVDTAQAEYSAARKRGSSHTNARGIAIGAAYTYTSLNYAHTQAYAAAVAAADRAAATYEAAQAAPVAAAEQADRPRTFGAYDEIAYQTYSDHYANSGDKELAYEAALNAAIDEGAYTDVADAAASEAEARYAEAERKHTVAAAEPATAQPEQQQEQAEAVAPAAPVTDEQGPTTMPTLTPRQAAHAIEHNTNARADLTTAQRAVNSLLHTTALNRDGEPYTALREAVYRLLREIDRTDSAISEETYQLYQTISHAQPVAPAEPVAAAQTPERGRDDQPATDEGRSAAAEPAIGSDEHKAQLERQILDAIKADDWTEANRLHAIYREHYETPDQEDINAEYADRVDKHGADAPAAWSYISDKYGLRAADQAEDAYDAAHEGDDDGDSVAPAEPVAAAQAAYAKVHDADPANADLDPPAHTAAYEAARAAGAEHYSAISHSDTASRTYHEAHEAVAPAEPVTDEGDDYTPHPEYGEEDRYISPRRTKYAAAYKEAYERQNKTEEEAREAIAAIAQRYGESEDEAAQAAEQAEADYYDAQP